MKPFPVYPLFDLELVDGDGCYVYDEQGKKYLDLYGGHAVISVGHKHPHYINALHQQLNQLAYYSNSVKLPIQKKLAQRLGELSGYNDYDLFLCNSGAEANENAIKLASFQTNRKMILAFEGAFHGRTHSAVVVTDNEKIQAPINNTDHVIRIPFNNESALITLFKEKGSELAAAIIEPIQGVNGIQVMDTSFMQLLSSLCKEYGALLIADEVQAGFGRSGQFFSHQHMGVTPDIISVAKGMGNGFPVGGILIHPAIKHWHGMLGTTFGGNPLACAATLAVLDIIDHEKLIDNAIKKGKYLVRALDGIDSIKSIRGLGLMIGIEFDFPIKPLRKKLIFEQHILTGSSKEPNVLRILPPLNIGEEELDLFIQAIKENV